MRVVDSMLFDNFLYNINRVNEQTFKTTTQMSSGKRLLNLSTDPIALSEVLSLKDINSRFEQYTTNINAANGILDAEDTALSTSDNLIQQAASLLIEGANDTNDSSSRLAIAQKLDAIKSEIRNSANTIFEGKYLFSGYKTNTAPIQTKTQSTAITDKGGSDIEVKTAENFKDINQLQSGDYTIRIENNRLSIFNGNDAVVPIDSDSKDESNVGGNELSTSIDVSSKEGQWIDTGRGIKIKLPSNFPTGGSSYDIKMTYQAGGSDIYTGDDNARRVEYSDNLSSSITITAKEIYKAKNHIIKNNNAMIDMNTRDPVVPQTKLTDIRLMSALKDVSLETGDEININGTDHNGNLIQDSFSVASNTTLNDLIDAVKSLDSTEVLENNRTFRTQDGLAVSGTKLSSLGITSNITFSGSMHGGSAVSAVFSTTSATTLGSLASFISSHFNVNAYIAHGKIEVEDEQSGKSNLSIRAQTASGNHPVLGMFNTTSIGGSGGFVDTADLFIKDGHLYIEDKRAGKSKLNLSFDVKDASGNPKPNVLGLFNVVQEGGGVDVFRTLSDASKALGDPDSYSQISKPTNWSAGSTLIPTISGKYLGGINDQWTVSVTQGSYLSNIGDEAKLSVSGQNSPTGNNKIADIDIKKTSGGYDISVFNQDGILITNYKNAADLSNIVIQTKNADSSFSAEGINGEAGVTLNLSSIGGLSPKLSDGDSFSFNVSNAIEDAIAKSKDILDQLLNSRAIVGARTNRFKLAKDRITTTQVSNKKSISELEDANMAQVFVDYQKEQIIMQATLNFGSKLSQNNLFSYI